MSILDRAVAHYEDLPVHSLEIPEWDATVYWRELTTGDRAKLLRQIKASGNDGEINARLLILKATDEQGKPLFTLGDLKRLRDNVSAIVVDRIAQAILGEAVSPEDAIKN